jgi:hypothetical protein
VREWRFFTWALMEMNGHIKATVALSPQKTVPVTQWIENLVFLHRAGLDAVEDIKICHTYRKSNPARLSLQPIAIPNELSRLM